jgi:PTS system nitrogen regulatory IIA component
MPFRFLNSAEAAQYLSLAPAHLERLVKDDAIPFQKRGERLVFNRSDLDAWVSQRILSSNAERLSEFVQHRRGQEASRYAHQPLIPDLIGPAQIDPEMQAKTKPSILREMAALAAATGWVFDQVELTECLVAREEIGSTALPGGLALLHPQAQQPYLFERSFLMLGRVIQPIHFGCGDGQPTDLFFLLCCQDPTLHLHALARLCLMAQEVDLLPELRAALDAKGMYECLAASEGKVLSAVPSHSVQSN